MAKTEPAYSKKKDANIHLAGLDIGKKPPQAIDLEEAVLGAIMLEKDAIINVQDLLKMESFYKEAHQKIYRSIQDLSTQHQPIDIYTVAEELKRKGVLEEVGGPYYLAQLTLRVGSAAHIEYHAKVIAEKYIQRSLIGISSEIQRDAFDDDIHVGNLLDNAQQKIFDLAEKNIRSETRHVGNIIDEAIKEIEASQQRSDGLSGTASGFMEIDKFTLGFQPSDLTIVAARPSMGKTAFVLSMARNMAIDHHTPVAFFSLEMSSLHLVKRLITSETGIASDKIRGGQRLADHEWKQLETKVRNLIDAPLYIDDTPALSIFEFRSKARRLVMAHQIKVIVIDYLQLMTGPPDLRGLREQEVSAISRSLKAIAKELNVPIIALSQLNRAVETRGGNKRPQLSDLRESGAIEQDADLVLFIHRPEYYGIPELTDGTSSVGIAEIIIAKHRNGATGDVKLRFYHEQVRFSNLDEEELRQIDSKITAFPEGHVTFGSKMNLPQRKIPQNKDFDLPPERPKADF
ncbi:MAG: replicative DNA helicase [Bacteroidales bacterium]|nr:replicative DNA helicase [Bacteroidales bacterium]MCL2133303.1 replicative DNA helicase [Bacteroidales bacterium]